MQGYSGQSYGGYDQTSYSQSGGQGQVAQATYGQAGYGQGYDQTGTVTDFLFNLIFFNVSYGSENCN